MRAVVVLPTYNELQNIEAYIAALHAAVSGLGDSVDLLVVDDSSPDGTGDLVRSIAEHDECVSILERPGKTGLGSAYRDGFTRVLGEGYDIVISMDADLSHDPAVIPVMLGLIDAGADAVIGSRYVPGGATPDWPLHRRLLSRWGNRYTRTILRIEVGDCTSGFRAYRASALRAIEPDTTQAEGYAFLTELVRRLSAGGLEVVETPIVFRNRALGTSKMSGRIIAESMIRVTMWGVAGAVSRMRGPRRSA